MSIKIGDIDVINEVIELHYHLIRTQLLLEEILNNNPEIKQPSSSRTDAIDNEVIKILNNKFPNMGIKKKMKE